jgi:outer membrane receptor protein involved in Fe transport
MPARYLRQGCEFFDVNKKCWKANKNLHQMKSLQLNVSGVCVMLMILLIPTAYSQTEVKGKVLDEQEQIVPYANILLLNMPDSSLVLGTFPDEEGKFLFSEVSSGRYWLNVSMIGYEPYSMEIEVGKHSPPAYEIFLKEDIRQLEEVYIVAQKPLYEKQPDRTVVNVKSSVLSTGRSVLEILAKSPGITLNRQSNTISMNGKGEVQIMVNGKLTRMPVDAVVQMLDGMSAANVEKVELIHNPPSKYDAEGAAGLINIVMTDREDIGTHGNIGTSAGYNGGITLATNGSVTHRTRKLQVYADYSILYDKNDQPWTDTRTIVQPDFIQQIFGDQRRRSETTTQNLRAGIEWQMTAQTSARLNVTGFKRNWDLNGETEHVHYAKPDSAIFTDMNVHENNIWKSTSMGVGITHKFDEVQTIEVDYDYLYYENNNPSTYNNIIQIDEFPGYTQFIDVTKKTPIRFNILNVGYSNIINEQLTMEAGVKGSWSSFHNMVSVEISATDNELSDDARLNEDIFAAYVSVKGTIGKKLTYSGGLRYEYTDSYLSTSTETGLIDREYGDFFPSATISYELDDQSSLMLGYISRITRPSFNSMAPFVFFTGPNSFIAGNPGLQPAKSQGVELSYTLNPWWLNISYTDTRDSQGHLQPSINSDGSVIYRSENLEYFKSLSITASIPISVTSWWEFQNNFSTNFQRLRTAHLINNYSDQMTSFSFSGTNTFTLPKDITIELAATYQSKMIMGIWEFNPMGQVDIGIRKELSGDRGTITLSITDIFDTSAWDAAMTLPDGSATTSWYYDLGLQSVTLGYIRTFGNKKVKSGNKRSTSEMERNRVN